MSLILRYTGLRPPRRRIHHRCDDHQRAPWAGLGAIARLVTHIRPPFLNRQACLRRDQGDTKPIEYFLRGLSKAGAPRDEEATPMEGEQHARDRSGAPRL